MLLHYRFGTPLPTDGVVKEVPLEPGPVPYLLGGPGCWQYKLAEGDQVYGLGEAIRGINKRGWRYVSNCTDEPNHTEDKVSLYGAHDFLLVDGGDRRFGVYLDYSGQVEYDVGYTARDMLQIKPADEHYDLYLITGPSDRAIVREFRALIGQSYIPPKWAFGYGQSRWSYCSEAEVRAVAEGYRSNGIPLDSIYLDIDYMKDYRDFTVDPEKFPDLPGLAADLKAQNLHLVPIIDAGVKIEPGDPVYESGKEGGYFAKDGTGQDFVGAVWPGLVHFPDFFQPEARQWFGRQYQRLIDQGIEGFWNDMNEPAIFYSPDRLRAVMDALAQCHDTDLYLYRFFSIRDAMNSLANNPEDYANLYHKVDGQLVCHDKLHNLYGANMTRAAGAYFETAYPDHRMLLFSRASHIGAHRYGGIWYGDNHSWWSHLALNLKMLPSANMCGFLFSGADLGGFGSNVTEDLLLRWLQLGVFTPLMRNHCALGCRPQEVYQFPEKQAMANLLGIRYGLLPYLYSEFVKAALEGDMLFRPLHFDYPDDPHAAQVETQLMLGEGLMIAPVLEQNATGRYVYLPEPMKLVRMRSTDDYETEDLDAGHHYIDVGLRELAFFIRPGCVIPLAQAAQSVAELDTAHLTLLHNVTQGVGTYVLYDDDGYTRDYRNPAHYRTLTVTV